MQSPPVPFRLHSMKLLLCLDATGMGQVRLLSGGFKLKNRWMHGGYMKCTYLYTQIHVYIYIYYLHIGRWLCTQTCSWGPTCMMPGQLGRWIVDHRCNPHLEGKLSQYAHKSKQNMHRSRKIQSHWLSVGLEVPNPKKSHRGSRTMKYNLKRDMIGFSFELSPGGSQSLLMDNKHMHPATKSFMYFLLLSLADLQVTKFWPINC